MSHELHYGAFQKESRKRSFTANDSQYSPPKMDGHETTTSHIMAQPTHWKRIKKNWQVAITAVWMSFVMADSFVSHTHALVRKTLKYWCRILWWIWMVDDFERCCFQVSVMLDSDRKEKRKEQTSLYEFHNQQSLKRHLLTRSVLNNCGHFPLRVINDSANEQEVGWLQPPLTSRQNSGRRASHILFHCVLWMLRSQMSCIFHKKIHVI